MTKGQIIKGQIIRIIAIILACVLLDIVLHLITTSYSSMPENANFSLVASILGIEITASLWALFAFLAVTFVFLNIRDEIPGEGLRKGLRYGTAIAFLWLFAMLEGVPLFGNSIVNEFIVGLSDAIPVFALSILLSRLQIEKAKNDRPTTSMPWNKIKAVSIFTGIFLAGRYIAYCSGVIQSGIQSRPLETFVWTLLMGISISTAYVILGDNRNERPAKHKAMRFGFLVFGLNWAVFLVFMPLLFSGYIPDVFLRIIIDTTLITISTYLVIIPSGRLMIKKKNPEEIIDVLKGGF